MNANMIKTVLGFVSGALALGLLFVFWVYPEVPTASYTLGGLLIVSLGALGWYYQKSLKEAAKSRSVRYGANALVTVLLVLCILVVVNFVNSKHFWRHDFTAGKIHGMSEQTIKILKELKEDVKLTIFDKVQNRDANKKVIENYLYYAGSKLKVEYIDPVRDPDRAKALNVKKFGTAILEQGKKETRVEEITEEKLTNGLIKLFNQKEITVCFLTGHGEKPLDDSGQESLSTLKQDLASQNYLVKSVSILESAKVPAECTVLAIMGPNRAFFPKEVDILKAWLKAGGKALFALDPNVKGAAESSPEMTKLLSEWYVRVNRNLVIDPSSRLLGVNAAVPVVGLFNKEQSIVKDLQAAALFPLSSTLETIDGAPATLKVNWLAKTTAQAFAKTDFKEIATGAVKLDPKKDKAGPHIMSISVEGKLVAEDKDARIVVMSTSGVAVNAYARHGSNMDLFLNSISWLANDESLISIRPKTEENQVPQLTETEGRYIQLITTILIPGSIMLLGFIVWYRRRGL